MSDKTTQLAIIGAVPGGYAAAFLAARDARVFVATPAGNAGPDADTVGSPGNAPWITAVGASTSNRQAIDDLADEITVALGASDLA